MTNPCPDCGAEVRMVDPEEVDLVDEYGGIEAVFEQNIDLWYCDICEWHREATAEESLDNATEDLNARIRALALLPKPTEQ